jgi:putative transposase
VPYYRRNLRLPADEYRGRRAYFATVCSDWRRKILGDRSAGDRVLHHLAETAARHHYYLHAYCVMPDHVHFLCEGASNECEFLTFVNLFKQCTAFELRKTCGSPVWQKRFYDHVLRPNEGVEDVAIYIWWNPVRAGICAAPNLYPLSGSQTLDWIQRSQSPTSWKPPWNRESAQHDGPA